jgi:hypothetical protein
VAGLESSLPFEEDAKMKELPTIKYDQKNVSDRMKELSRRIWGHLGLVLGLGLGLVLGLVLGLGSGLVLG